MEVWTPGATCSSAATSWRAGAIIVEATGVMNAHMATVMVANHFLLIDQFLGFSGSSGPFQPVEDERGIASLTASTSTKVFSVSDLVRRHGDGFSTSDTRTDSSLTMSAHELAHAEGCFGVSPTVGIMLIVLCYASVVDVRGTTSQETTASTRDSIPLDGVHSGVLR